jgi:hypothetical protein
MIAKTGGNDDLDRLPANFVAAHRQYLSGSANGQPIEAWPTLTAGFSVT